MACKKWGCIACLDQLVLLSPHRMVRPVKTNHFLVLPVCTVHASQQHSYNKSEGLPILLNFFPCFFRQQSNFTDRP